MPKDQLTDKNFFVNDEIGGNMRIYISMDAEGISGIYKLGQVMPSHQTLYPWAQRMMANDVNAAVEGAYRAGATQVIVNDAHNAGNNLLIDQLDERVDLISGGIRPLGMAEGCDLGCDAALFIGYHKRKGGKGVASHSYAYGTMVEMRLNGTLISEHDLVGLCIGAYDVPVVFLSGDDQVIEDAKKSIPGIYTVETKIAISNNAALCHHPKRNAENITNTVEKALRSYKDDGIKPMKIDGQIELDVRYTAEAQAAMAMGIAGTIRLDENTVRYSGTDYLTVYRAFLNGTTLAGIFRDDADLYL